MRKCVICMANLHCNLVFAYAVPSFSTCGKDGSPVPLSHSPTRASEPITQAGRRVLYRARWEDADHLPQQLSEEGCANVNWQIIFEHEERTRKSCHWYPSRGVTDGISYTLPGRLPHIIAHYPDWIDSPREKMIPNRKCLEDLSTGPVTTHRAASVYLEYPDPSVEIDPRILAMSRTAQCSGAPTGLEPRGPCWSGTRQPRTDVLATICISLASGSVPGLDRWENTHVPNARLDQVDCEHRLARL
ncbi:hypothetical protein LIA77_03741 [Sarocladium implicatum]|nr:hypothetical protein LIA77_03741 [Sarocladium implicatum]